MKTARSPFKLNELRVDPDAGTIESDKGVRRLAPRLMTLLCLLSEAGSRTVERDELVQALWPRGFINEDALSRTVAELRRKLRDDARNPRFIETVPKRGYRLLATVVPITEPGETVPGSQPGQWNRYLVAAGIVLTTLVIYLALNSREPAINSALMATATRLTADPVMKYQPQLSPDGSLLAYLQRQEDTLELILLPTDQPTRKRRLAHAHSAWSPVFAPDSRQLAVAILEDEECEVHRWSVSGEEEPVPLAPCVVPNESPILDWSADGRFVAYVDTDSATESGAIWQIALADGSRAQLTSPPDGYSFDTRPRYSPDGRWLSFSRGTRAAREIWVLSLDDSSSKADPPNEPRQLSFDHQFSISHQWMPDSHTIVLDSERSGYRALWTLTLDGDWQLLGARDAESPSIASNRMAFKVSQFESNIWPVDLETGQPSDQPLLESNKYDSNPAWSPDGRKIAFTSNRTGRGAIWLASADGSNQQLVYEPETGRVVAPAWSPDGSFLIATRYQTGGQNLIRIPLDGSEAVPISTASQRPYSGIYSEDGAWIYYIAKGGIEGNRLWRQPSDGSAPGAVVVQQPVNTFRLVPGLGIYYTKYGQQGLYRVSLDEPANETLVIEELVVSGWGDWVVEDNWVYYLANGDAGTTAIFRKRLEGGNAEWISDFYPTAMWPNLAINPNAGTILVARTDRAQSDLFLVELEP